MKKDIKELLKEKQYDRLVRLSMAGGLSIRDMISLTYDKKSIICWRAIETIGLITKEVTKRNPEIVRNTVGRLLWMIRDESGGIGWSSPEILGEIVRNNPELFSDVAPIIVSFHDEIMLRTGVLWAIGRMDRKVKGITKYATAVLIPHLHSPDKVLRGNAALALGEIGALEAKGELGRLKDDDSYITIYFEGDFNKKTVGEISREAIKKLECLNED